MLTSLGETHPRIAYSSIGFRIFLTPGCSVPFLKNPRGNLNFTRKTIQITGLKSQVPCQPSVISHRFLSYSCLIRFFSHRRFRSFTWSSESELATHSRSLALPISPQDLCSTNLIHPCGLLLRIASQLFSLLLHLLGDDVKMGKNHYSLWSNRFTVNLTKLRKNIDGEWTHKKMFGDQEEAVSLYDSTVLFAYTDFTRKLFMKYQGYHLSSFQVDPTNVTVYPAEVQVGLLAASDLTTSDTSNNINSRLDRCVMLAINCTKRGWCLVESNSWRRVPYESRKSHIETL